MRAWYGDRWWRILGAERGAILWLPALGAAAWLVLFAMRIAPSGQVLFTRMTSLRVAVAGTAEDPDTRRTVAALRRNLANRGAFSVVDSARAAAGLDAAALSDRDDALARALRPLNAQVAVTTEVERRDGGVFARMRAFDARSGRWVAELHATGAAPEALGAALADSLAAATLARPPLAAAVR